MPVIKIKFGDDGQDMSEPFEKFINDFFQVLPVGVPINAPHKWQPSLNMCEDEEFLYILANMAGVPKEECSVTVEGQFVRIKGRRISPIGQGARHFHFMEVVYGQGERLVKLPCEIEPEGVIAHLENGLLMIKLLKKMPDASLKITVEE